MRDIELTDKERLFLANQYEILGLLKNEDYYTEMAQTLRDGHQWLYQQIFDSLCENLADNKVQHVLTILDIYSSMRDSFRELSDKSGIDEKALVFPGFDGNNESDLLSFAHNLIKHGRFSSTLGEHAQNSHHPTYDIYRRMIDCWDELGKPNYPYSKGTIQKILESRIHPEHRK